MIRLNIIQKLITHHLNHINLVILILSRPPIIHNDIIMQSNESKKFNIWPPRTILIASDSMLKNVDETRLRKNKYNVNVRSFRGSVNSSSEKVLQI